MKVAVSLLVYNEGENLEQTIRDAYRLLSNQNLDFELWVMDNHSTDNTPEIMKKLQPALPRLKHFRQSENIGYAMNTLASFKVPQADIYATIDGDAQYTVDDIPACIEKIKQGADVVVGWRVQRNDPMDRIFMTKIFNFITKSILSCRVHDLNCGFRVMNRRSAELIGIHYKEKFAGPEIFARARQHRLNVTEIVVQHFHRTAGQSVYNGGKIISALNMIKYLFTLRLEMVSGRNSSPLLYSSHGKN